MVSELMQPIITQHDIFVDIDLGPLVQGKVEILDPVSTNPINVYTYNEDEYVIAANPVILDVEGRPELTIFSDRLSYLRVYAFDGYDEHNNPLYHFVRDFYAGHNAQSEVSDSVIGIEGLKDLNPEYNTKVTVIGYHNQFDCEPRTYVWDPNSTLDPDNGYVVGSDVSDSGRWILQFDGAYIPSSYYGVYPGQTANINALSTYIGEIHGKATAPGIFLIPGNYGNVSMTTTKKVLLFSNTQLNSLECSWIDVKGRPSTWIGNIFPSDSTCPVYSSWYKHARSFWGNNSKVKHTDGRNWIDNDIIANMTNSNVTFITHQGTKLTTNTGAYKLVFTNCKVEGDYGFLDKDSACRFIEMEMSDRFYVNNAITPANIEFSTVSGQEATLILNHFAKVENYAALLYKTGTTIIDMDNIYCGNITAIDLSEYTEIRNLNANNATIGKSGNSVKVIDSKASYVDFNGSALYLDHTNIRLKSFPNVNSISADNDSIVQGGFSLTRGSVACHNSTWAMNINEATDNNTLGPSLSFRNSTILATINAKNIQLYDCAVRDSVISVYPYRNNASRYVLYLRMERCDVTNSDNPTIQFKKIYTDNVCKNCYWDVRMIGNDFQGNTLGVTCPYFANRDTRELFIARDNDDSTGNHNFWIKNNTGNCPKCADFQALLQSDDVYNYNTNLDHYVSYNMAIDVLGGNPARIWCCYGPHGDGSTQANCNYNYAIKSSFTEGRTPGALAVFNRLNKNEKGWLDRWINNANFAENCVDPNWSWSGELEDIDDWFAARVIQPQDQLNVPRIDFDDVVFKFG